MNLLKKPLVTRGWDKDILAKYELGDVPLVMGNMTNQCNYNCIYCHTDAGKKDENELNADEWIRILDESKELGNEVFWIGGKGEPILDNAFRKVIRHADDIGLTTVLNTNGSLITKKRAKLLYNNNVSPEVKIISFDEDVYDYLSGTIGNLPALRKGLNNLIKAGYRKIVDETDDARITRMSGMLLMAKPAYQSMPDVFRYCDRNNFAPVVSDVVASGRVVKRGNLDELKLSDEEKKNIWELGSEIMSYPLNKGIEECQIQYGIVVQNNGDLIIDTYGMSCDVCDYYGRRVAGNLREISLKEGWEIIKEERKRNETARKIAYDQFKEECSACLASCPMAHKSQKDYYGLN
ncbi:MAG: radical SAM protein [Nanoarchaeota archaeon]|nr:radical SAM protein [Nanoarchaeota archaeon]MBU4299945.1 radical SAM protein [Nanoarchaeota archaeon]MBU4451306.1 radical SAM protein [Nanoarchaeota archaeon]MCG2723677.1 radical SAM protein [archaeon]